MADAVAVDDSQTEEEPELVHNHLIPAKPTTTVHTTSDDAKKPVQPVPWKPIGALDDEDLLKDLLKRPLVYDTQTEVPTFGCKRPSGDQVRGWRVNVEPGSSGTTADYSSKTPLLRPDSLEDKNERMTVGGMVVATSLGRDIIRQHQKSINPSVNRHGSAPSAASERSYGIHSAASDSDDSLLEEASRSAAKSGDDLGNPVQYYNYLGNPMETT